MTEKASFYPNKDSWEKFKDKIYQQQGTLRTLSKELNKIIEDHTLYHLEENLRKIVSSEREFSINQIKTNRPKVTIKSESLVREMRDSNVSLSR